MTRLLDLYRRKKKNFGYVQIIYHFQSCHQHATIQAHIINNDI